MTNANLPEAPAPRRRPKRVESKSHARVKFWKWLAAGPSIVALTTSVALAVMISTRSSKDALPWYHLQADQAMKDRNYALASVCYQRLAADEPNDPANQFGLALSLNGAGRPREAMQLINQLTPPDGPGYAPARLLLGQQLLAYPAHTPEMVQRAEQNLLEVLKTDPLNETANGLLTTIYAGQGKWELARHYLERSGSLRPSLESRLFPQGS